jgi:hypothetical protein
MCDSEIADDNPALKQAALVLAVESQGGWSRFEGRNVGYKFKAGDFSCTVEAKQIDPGYAPNGYDGAYSQGETFETYVVISVGDTFFKKTGTGDSYGEVSWDGEVKQTKMTEKVVRVLE